MNLRLQVSLLVGVLVAGATAAAYASALYEGAQSPVDVLLPGGSLTVEIVDEEAWVTGPANFVFSGSIG